MLRPRGIEWPSRLTGLFASISMSSEAENFSEPSCSLFLAQQPHGRIVVRPCAYIINRTVMGDRWWRIALYVYIYIQSIASTPSIFHFFTEFGPVCVCSNMFQRGTRWWNVAKSPADRPDRWAGALLSCSMFLASLSDIEKWSTYLRCAYTWEEFQDFYAKTHSNKVGSLRCFCLNKRDENTREEPSRIPKLD